MAKDSPSSTGFRKTRKDELLGILKEGKFKEVRRSEVPEGTRVFGLQFID